jgi:hypothetical protein
MLIASTLETYFTVGTYVFSFIMGGFIVILTRLKKWLKKEDKTPAIENKFIRIHSQIDELLTEMRIKLNCNRTGICKFHNGGYFFDGVSIVRTTTTHESCSLGTSSTMDNSQGVLLTRFMDKIEILQKNEPIVNYTKDMKDGNYKAFLESKNVVAFSIIPFFDTKHMKLGHLFCDWCEYEDVEDIDKQYIYSIILYYRRLINSLLLSEHE